MSYFKHGMCIYLYDIVTGTCVRVCEYIYIYILYRRCVHGAVAETKGSLVRSWAGHLGRPLNSRGAIIQFSELLTFGKRTGQHDTSLPAKSPVHLYTVSVLLHTYARLRRVCIFLFLDGS